MAFGVVHWFRDRAVQKVMRFGVPAAIGKVFMSVAGLVTMALLARQLGAAAFGVIAVIRTVVAMVEQYANFNTWQAIIKYGTEAIAGDRPRDVERVIKLAVVMDAVTALLAMGVIAGIAFVIPSTFGWTLHEAQMCALYGVTVATRVSGASDGIFRICDAYRAQAISTSVGAAAMTAAVAVAVALDASFDGCVLALIIGEVAGNVLVTLASFKVASDHGYGGWLRAPLHGARETFPGIVHFLLATNGQLTIKKTNAELDMVMVGALLGKVSAGLFRVVKQLGTIPGRIFMPFEQVVFTELARSAAAHDYRAFGRLLRRFSGAVAAGSLVIWAVAALTAEPLIRLVAGEEFVVAADAFRIYLLAMVLVIATAPTMRALVALDRPGSLFFGELATMLVQIASLVVGARWWGLEGVAGAVVLHRLLQLAWAAALVRATLRARNASVDRDRSLDGDRVREGLSDLRR